MYHRGFKKREVRAQPVAAKMFSACQLTEVEQVLWDQRVKLAAAIARLRIEKSALRLSDLLPQHLRGDKCTSQDVAPVTCWVNIRKMRYHTVINRSRPSFNNILEIKMFSATNFRVN